MIELRLLGPIELRGGDGRDVTAVLAQPKRLAALVYLAAARPYGFIRRDKLVGLLWPDFDQSRARQALNKTVHHLRQALGESAIVSRGDQELAIDDAILRCDVRELDQALAAGDRVAALALYRGPFADGLFITDAADFEHWLSAERERLRTAAADAAGEESDAVAPADSTGAIPWARRAVDLAPFDERVARRLMNALDRNGDAAGAVRAYDDLVGRLASELGIAPSLETKALRESLGSSAQLRPAAPTGPPAQVSSPLIAPSSMPPAARETQVAARMTRRMLAALVITGCIAVGAIAAVMARRSRAHSLDLALGHDRLFVAALENRTGDSALGGIGAMASDWMIQGLTAAEIVPAVDPQTAMLVDRGGNASRGLDALADASGAKLVITGAYYRQGDSLRFEARLSDTGAGQATWTFEPVVVPAVTPEAALSPLQDQALTVVAQAAGPQLVPVLRSRMAPPRYDAYREYMSAVDYSVHRDEERAYQHFLMAARLDTTFTEPLLDALSLLRSWTSPDADSIMRVVARRRDALSPASRLWFEALEAWHRHELLAATRSMGELARRYPESLFPYVYANQLFAFDHPYAADSAFRAIDPGRGWMHGWFSYGAARIMVDDVLDSLGAERNDVAAAVREYPHHIGAAAVAAFYIGRTGQRAQLDSLFDEAVALPQVGNWGVHSVMGIAAVEAAAHGHGDWLPHIRARALAWYDALPAAERDSTPVVPYDLSWMLAAVRAWPQLGARIDRLERLAHTTTESSRSLCYRGLVAGHAGDTATVRRIDGELAARLDRAGEETAGDLFADRARLAAVLGQRDRAIDLLRQAFAHHVRFEVYLHSDPAFETIWSDPRFKQLMAPKG
jgi:DNA-binding SARP family transcriptional activator